MAKRRGRPPKIKVIQLPSNDKLAPTTEITVTNGAKVYEKPAMKARREFTITFTSIPERVICPDCKKLQFTVNQGSTNANIVRVCDKCGARITYVFAILPFGVATSSPLQ